MDETFIFDDHVLRASYQIPLISMEPLVERKNILPVFKIQSTVRKNL